MKTLSIILLFITITSCETKVKTIVEPEKAKTAINVDSLNNEFLAGWNNQDSTAVMNTMAENAILINDTLIFKGKRNIANWVSGGVKVLSNIQSEILIDGTSGEIAYNSGTYTLDLTIPGSPVLKEKGNYSLVWTKQENEEWLIHIEDVSRLPDVK